MATESIRMKLELASIETYDGGANQLLNDIKEVGVVVHNDANGYYVTSESASKFSATTEYAEKLNQIQTLSVLNTEDVEIASLNIKFLNKDNDTVYNVPDNATISGSEINLTFKSYTVTFRNPEYPQFRVDLPQDITVLEGESVELPSISGSFEDDQNNYTPQKWSVGDFGESITPISDVTANLVWLVEAKTVTYTLFFKNTTYPDFDVSLPQDITDEAGTEVTLPSVSGTFEDEDYIYTPSAWSIGEFGSSITLNRNIEANLVWETTEKVTLPTVNLIQYYYVGSYPVSEPSGRNVQLHVSSDNNADLVPYDATKLYAANVSNGAGITYYSEWKCINYYDTLAIENISSEELRAYAASVFVCSSTSVTIINVYDSNDNKFQSFKFTLSGTDYYYVLDETQTEWTDDLSSIGYSLSPAPFISDKFIDVTEAALALNPIPHYENIYDEYYLWYENLGGRSVLGAYATAASCEFIAYGYDSYNFKTASLNQTEIPVMYWLNSNGGFYDLDPEIIEALGLTNAVQNAPDYSAILRIITSISGQTLENITFGNIVRVDFIQVLFNEYYNGFGDEYSTEVYVAIGDYDTDTGMADTLPIIRFSYEGDITDEITVPLSDCFLVKNSHSSYYAFKTTIPANTIHVNGELYNKPLTVEYADSQGLLVYESTPYDLA